MNRNRKVTGICILICLVLIGIIFFISCKDELDIRQDYPYQVATLPLPKMLKTGEPVLLEFFIVRQEGHYKDAGYKFRYFQTDGKGFLYDGGNIPFTINQFYDIAGDEFILKYVSDCTEKQTLDFVFEDNFGRQVEYQIEFAHDDR